MNCVFLNKTSNATPVDNLALAGKTELKNDNFTNSIMSGSDKKSELEEKAIDDKAKKISDLANMVVNSCGPLSQIGETIKEKNKEIMESYATQTEKFDNELMQVYSDESLTKEEKKAKIHDIKEKKAQYLTQVKQNQNALFSIAKILPKLNVTARELEKKHVPMDDLTQLLIEMVKSLDCKSAEGKAEKISNDKNPLKKFTSKITDKRAKVQEQIDNIVKKMTSENLSDEKKADLEEKKNALETKMEMYDSIEGLGDDSSDTADSSDEDFECGEKEDIKG